MRTPIIAIALVGIGSLPQLACGGRPSLAEDTAPRTPDARAPADAFAAATTRAPAPDVAAAAPAPRYPDARTVVFATPAEEPATLPTPAAGQAVTASWVPSDEDIARFDRGLPAHLRLHRKDWTQPALDSRQASYFRQFRGLVAGGRRFVYGSFFCQELPNWKTASVGVDDGGDCFFEVMMDADTGEFVGLMINGIA